MRSDPWRRSLAFISFVLVVTSEGCWREKETTPETDRRNGRFDAVARMIGEAMTERKIASVAIAAAKDGRVVWEEAFGWADREREVPATPQSIYAIASVSKSFTATGLMVLVERGLVDLERPINDYLAAAKLVAHAGDTEEATVRRVLQHSAGLPTYMNLFFESEGGGPPDQDESIRRYGFIADRPGREFVYSNFGYGLLDRVISAVSGVSYAEFMREEVFAPLGLKHTSVLVDPALQPHAVRHDNGQGRVVPELDSDHRGASAVHSSVHDLIRYAMFHLRDDVPGQKRILSAEAIGLMQIPSELSVPGQGAGEVRVGLGWAITVVEGVRVLVATGGMPGTVARLALIPDERAAVAITINSGVGETYSPWDIEWETFAALIPGFPERPELGAEQEEEQPLPPGLQGEWTGSIETHQGDLAAKLSIGNGGDISLEIDGKQARPIHVRNRLGRVRFQDGVFLGPFIGSLPTDDCARSRHVLFLRLRWREDRLGGVASAVAMDRTFWLPHRMELRRR